MPDVVMHHYFGREVLSELNEKINAKLEDYRLYDFATAGPDPFFFVAFTNAKKNKNSREFGNYMHRHKTKAFFMKLVELTKKNNDLFPYLCGFVCHYFLDVASHPYIFYYTGVYNPDNPKTYEYRGLHTLLERAMDAYVIRNYYGSIPHKFKIHKHILTLKSINKKDKQSFDELFLSVYNHKNGYEHVNKSVKSQRKFYRFIYDPMGIKNKLLSKLDNGKSSLSLGVLSYYHKEVNDVDIFNIQHSYWTNPVDVNIVSRKSFMELFDEAKLQCINTINALYENIFAGFNNNIEGYFKNLSYITGLDCEHSGEMVNFQNIFTTKKLI